MNRLLFLYFLLFAVTTWGTAFADALSHAEDICAARGLAKGEVQYGECVIAFIRSNRAAIKRVNAIKKLKKAQDEKIISIGEKAQQQANEVGAKNAFIAIAVGTAAAAATYGIASEIKGLRSAPASTGSTTRQISIPELVGAGVIE
tara:strand:- start:42 stop:479 length:438 start_codon:yes stop_codon:yes gene_type:complete